MSSGSLQSQAEAMIKPRSHNSFFVAVIEPYLLCIALAYSLNSALARQTSCRCPTLRFSPPSDTAWSRPSGSEVTYSLTEDLFIRSGSLVIEFKHVCSLSHYLNVTFAGTIIVIKCLNLTCFHPLDRTGSETLP